VKSCQAWALAAYVWFAPSLRASAQPARGYVDQTTALQQSIDALPFGGVLDCRGAHYQVVTLQLKSNMTMQNCSLEAIPGSLDLTAPITIDGRGRTVENIVIRNVDVVGNRRDQTNIGYVGQEDGGRHCFRILGRVANLLIEGSSGSYCATDGIAFVSYGVSSSDNPADLPFQNITVRNSSFSFNRRHGVSAEGMNGATFDNVAFLNNGTTVGGGFTEGDLCASTVGNCFGTGFWYEDYRSDIAGGGLNDVMFSRCAFRNNFQRSLFFLTHEQPSVNGYRSRSNIRILNSWLDSGSEPLDEDYAIQFQVDGSLNNRGAVFQNILIQNTSLNGSIGLHQASNVSVLSTSIATALPWLGFGAGVTNIVFRDVNPSAKVLAAQTDPSGGSNPVVTFVATQFSTVAQSPPQTGTNLKGDVVWNSQNSSPTGWICVTGGTPCAQWAAF
jgi:hypothetical protein